MWTWRPQAQSLRILLYFPLALVWWKILRILFTLSCSLTVSKCQVKPCIHGLKIDDLKKFGKPAREAMQAFADWVAQVSEGNRRPVFVALNAPFDWMFVNDYFHRYLGKNPFGYSALDMKAYFMGQTGVDWSQTSMQHMSRRLLGERNLTHNALADAQDQAEIFRMILKHSPEKTSVD